MINRKLARRYCSEDLSLIENYQEAISVKTQTWDIHHRRETDEGLSARELMKRREYFHRPAHELIFLKHGEHTRLHNSNCSEETREKLSQTHSGEKCCLFGKHLSEETRKKISQALSGEKSYLLGKHLQEETKKKLSQADLGKKFSEETREKLSQAHLGKHWYNNGVKSVLAKSCPDGFKPGRL